MDEVLIKVGNQDVKLRKSRKFIAVKPRPEVDRKALSELVPELSASHSPRSRLGGFELINIAENETYLEETLDTLRENPAIMEGTHVFETSDDQVPFVPTGQLYVEFDPATSAEESQSLLDQHHLEIIESRAKNRFIVQVTRDSVNPVKTARALQESPLIKVAEPDLATPGQLEAFVIPNDPRLIDQWHLQNTGYHRGTSIGFKPGADARVVQAWEKAQSVGDPNVVVAIIDDGFDLSHPDLTGSWKIVAPKDFTRNTASPVPDPLSQDWHGTACAGVAVGNADGTGIVGAAPRSRLMPIRWSRTLSQRNIELWFDYVREQGAWVVSCSWKARAKNFALPTLASRAIARCAREGRGGLGTVICFAAGNENVDVNDPEAETLNGFATHPDVIAVAASNSRDQKSNYSNYGREISICGPSSGSGGWRITTSDVMGQYTRGDETFEAGYSIGAYTDDFGGTSSACPLVAGVCALLLSIKPDLTAAEVREIIQSTARRIGSPSQYDSSGHSREFGYGCIDALAAVESLVEESDIEPTWGTKGHTLVNELTVGAVPDDLRLFYDLHRDEVIELAMAADDAKKTDPAERPRHFLDIDLYGDFPFKNLPEDFNDAVAKFGKKTVLDRGIVPWQIETTYDKLVDAFRKKNGKKVIEHSGWLGHYVGDAHVPFHTTANHDGNLTGQKGLHSYFETRLLNKKVAKNEVHPKKGSAISVRPHVLAFEWVRESYTFVQPLLDADAANGGKQNKRDLEGFAKTAKPIAIDRLSKGCTRVASLWYSAWVEAGKPKISDLTS